MEKLYRIKEIIEMDYGCEGRPENEKAQVMVVLQGSLGSEKCIKQEDDYLYQKNISEHDLVNISADGKLEKKYVFRNVQEEDAQEIIEIEQICFPPHEACSPKNMTERVQEASDSFMVLEDVENKNIVGFINGIATNEEKFRDEFFTDISTHNCSGVNVMITGVDVRPEYEKRGIAGLMMLEYQFRSKKKGRKKLVLTNLDRLTPFYERMGFVDLGIAESNWGGEEWHEMELQL